MAQDDWATCTCAPVPSGPSQPAGDGSRAGTRILVVAEDLSYCEREIIPSLVEARLAVEITSAAADGLAALPTLRFDLVLLDIALKQGPGYQACVHIRNTCPVPLLLVLHGAARDEAWHVYQAGADAYILAPFDPRELLARLYALLRRQPARQGFA